MISVALVLVLSAAPIRVAGGLEPAHDVQAIGQQTWAALEKTLQPTHATREIVIERSRLAPGKAGASILGLISLRQQTAGVLTEDEKTALRHELAHQFLLQHCAPATGDRLFHEAFAISMSGELQRWRDDDYQTLSDAARTLGKTTSLDTAPARRALARLLVEGLKTELPEAVSKRLSSCDGRDKWSMLTVESMASLPSPANGAALIMSRHTGEVLWATGDIQTPQPFGSTLKPFLFASAVNPPALTPRPKDSQWACGEALPESMPISMAVLRSCNGYFLDWAAAAPGVERFGAWGPVLQKLGLAHLPVDMSEAIGIRSTLALSPLSLAAAYRALAEARPDVIDVMKRNAAEGTLAGLPESRALLDSAVATKTGTVRDGSVRATVGWLVGITRDFVIIELEPDRAPRQFAAQFTELLVKANAMPARDAVEVQVFGLLAASQIRAKCDRVGLALHDGVPTVLSEAFEPLKASKSLCLTGPFVVEVRDVTRPYAGVFRIDPPAPYVPAVGVTEGERRARQGSDFIFRTTRLSYVTGVIAAEDSAIHNEARAALARIISHNVDTRERHGSRPVCDTTHCQAFRGSVAPNAQDIGSLTRAPLTQTGWLPFSRGGTEPWSQTRPLKDVERALGFSWASVMSFSGENAMLKINRTVTSEGAPYEQVDALSCERLRGPLKLPSCPTSATRTAQGIAFQGVGRGHGLGLDVELAKKSGLTQDQMLEQAFGP